jgi:hypothetical protein
MSKRFQAGDYLVTKSDVTRFNVADECYWITDVRGSNALISEWDTFEEAKAECKRLAGADAVVMEEEE